MEITPARLAETEYHRLIDPQYLYPSRFGDFYNHAGFRTRHDAHQLCRTICQAGQVVDLLQEIDQLYAGLGLGHKKISGHDLATYHNIEPELSTRGWQVQRTWVMLWQKEPIRPANPAIEIRVVDETNLADLDSLHQGENGQLQPSYLFHRAQDARVGGERIIAYIDGRPAASTGWHLLDGVVRYRHVDTQEWARKQGAATTMLHYVQQHPVVQAQDGLTIFCGEDGPISLYEQMGFVKQNFMWEFLLLDE